ncbi:MAG: T9SS type A sorting domain-containing protein [Chitinophagaceae bacterium]|nr:T9SS type A sorting domain-containing protein [Chitinophagaceae bacterium]
MKKLLPLVYLLLITETLHAQSLFFGFEDWNEKMIYTDVYEYRASTPESPQCYPYLLGKAEEVRRTSGSEDEIEFVKDWSPEFGVGLMRTTEAHSGKYAAVVHIWYMYVGENLTYGPKGGKEAKVHFKDKLYGISGFYQYRADSFAPGDVYAETSLHTITYKKKSGGLEILQHDSLLFSKSDVYKAFYLPLTYSDTSMIPDSVSIWFASGMNKRPGVNSCPYAHFLYLDDLQFHFSPFPLSQSEEMLPRIKLHPNPAKTHISLEYNNATATIQGIRLSDLSGRVARTFGKNERLLDVQGIASGPYILTVFSDHGPMHQKVFIQ